MAVSECAVKVSAGCACCPQHPYPPSNQKAHDGLKMFGLAVAGLTHHLLHNCIINIYLIWQFKLIHLIHLMVRLIKMGPLI